MQIVQATFPDDLSKLMEVANEAFSLTPDSSISEWFSFQEMQAVIRQNRGICLKALSDDNRFIGMVFAAQESPINGRESEEKWVINIIGVLPKESDRGIGGKLLEEVENVARKRKIKKMFVFTNKGDQRVINFYLKNGYKDAGWIKDYQYGKDNSAAFLLKYL